MVAAKHQYITRLQNAWWVRIQGVGGKLVASGYFSDRKYGGKKDSEQAAVAYRDKLAKKHRANRKRVYSTDRRSKSGVVGVHLNKLSNNGNSYFYWTSSIMRDGKQTHQMFSIKKYGYDKAFLMAVKARYKYVGTPIPKGVKAPPMNKQVKAYLK